MKPVVFLLLFCALNAVEPAKILFITMPDGKSHWLNMAPLAERLVKDGHEVGIYMEAMSPATTSILDPQFLNYIVLLENTSFSNPLQDIAVLAEMLWNGESNPLELLFLWKHSYNCHRHVIEKQPNDFYRVANQNWDLIITGTLFTISGTVMAGQGWSRAPFALFITNPVETHVAYYLNLEWSTAVQPPMYMKHNKPTWTEESFWDRFFSLWHDSLSFSLNIGPIQWLKYKCSKSGWRPYFDHSTVIFRDSLQHLESPMPLTNQFVYTAKCRSTNEIKQLPEEIENFVSDPNSAGTIVVAFGTMVKWDSAPKHKLSAMVDALKLLSDYRIIWAFKGNWKMELPFHIRILSWIPQIDLLNHNKTKLFVSHGGIKRY